MSKLVTLEIGEGDFARGFSVTLRIGEDGSAPAEKLPGRLPPAQMIPQHYDSWQSSYRERGMGAYRKLEPIQGQTTNLSVSDSAEQLEGSLNEWLNSGNKEFQPIRDRLLEALSQNQGNIRLIIETDDVQMWQLPWHLWSVLDERYKLEPSFSVSAYEKKKAVPKLGNAKVRILVILGDSTDINVQADLELLKEQLADAHIQPLIASRREQLSDELWEQNWDILFFAGHSSSESGYGQGRFDINETESITIEDLKDGLQNAINHGLCLAIFNSCDGLGLARSLASLEMPAIVVMRERVPDEAAQKFLKLFLKAFAKDGKSLSDSVREARKRLRESMEGQYPCASWLPVLFESPAQEPPTWIGLRKRNEERRKRLSFWRSVQTVLLAGVAVTGLVMGVRWVGLLQPSELQAYDHLMEMRPAEPPDSRILIVGADADDFRNYGGYPLPDATIAQLINKIDRHQPAVIGLTIYRDLEQPPGHEALVAELQKNQRLITICKYVTDKKGTAPPPKSPQVGFDNLLFDQDSTVRRYLLSRRPNPTSTFDPCATDYSFGFQIANQYLWAVNFNDREKVWQLESTDTEELWQLGSAIFQRLKVGYGGYQKIDDRGYQVLLNYRSTSQIARKLTVTDILTDKFEPAWVNDKVVLIGVTDDDSWQNHEFNTPVGKMRGVIVQAHAVSQILSAVFDKRPLIWWLPQWGDAIWVWIWSVTGGAIVCYLRSSPLRLWLGISISITVLYGLCFAFFTQGGWLPLVPSALALVATGIAVAASIASQTRQSQ
ncbi:MAG: CHASE2 domain-containing protein [Oscillatoria princeps RMCB-10]|jgi:CHASE2 domain-containing sensor protein|nr:CHASE2 domain-containing protein [Oscillatoria princeps RMCB-10]